jgi:hypothetical protein
MALNATIDLTVKKPDFKSMKSEIRELTVAAQQAVMQFGEFSPEAVRAEQALAGARDRMDDFNDRVKAVNPDKFAQLQTVVSGVARGFQAAQGAMALFGNESKDLERTMIKLQGAMALADGLEGLGKIQQQFKAIFTDVVAGSKKAFAAIKAGIGSTGIGLIVIALGSIVAYWDEIRFAIMGVSEETKKAKLEQDKYNQSIKELNRERELLLYGELAAKKTELLEIETETNKLYDRQGKIQERLKVIAQSRLLANTEHGKVEEARLNAEFNAAQLRIEKLTNLEIAATNAITKIEKDDEARKEAERKNRIDKKQSQADKDAQKEKDRLENLARLQQELIEADRLRRLSLAKTEEEERKIKFDNERLAIRDKYQKDLKDFEGNQEALKLIRQKYQSDIATAQTNFNKQEEQKAKDQAAKDKQLQNEALKNLVTNTDQFNAKYKKNHEERLAADAAEKQSKQDLYEASISLANAVIGLAGEQSKTGKALALATIAADTAMSISNAMTVTTSPSPDNVATGGIAGVAKYIALAAMILNNAKRARDILKGGQPSAPSGGGQMNGGGMPQMSAPNISSSLPTVGQFDTKVFVTEGDIRRTTDRVDTTRKVSVVK